MTRALDPHEREDYLDPEDHLGPGDHLDPEDYVERVLARVEAIPVGRVSTYGDLAASVGVGGPRQVGAVMARHGAAVPWWRVVRADGRPARGHEGPALARLRAEGAPLRGDRVDLARARIGP